jgi:hypothetical protein
MSRRKVGLQILCLLCGTGSSAEAAAAECFATIASGSGASSFKVCISERGNVVSFETPAGYEQAISGDGYVLCSAGRSGVPTVHGWDAGGYGEAGFAAPSIDQPNGPDTLPLTITRVTLDGDFEVVQTFVFDGFEKDLTINTRVTNLTDEPRQRVALARFLRMSPNQSVEAGSQQGENNATRTADSVLLWDDSDDNSPQGPAFGVGLTARSFGTRHDVVVEDHDDWNPEDSDGPQRAEGCSPIPTMTPKLGLRDQQGRVTYDFGTIGRFRSRRVSFLYRHF